MHRDCVELNAYQSLKAPHSDTLQFLYNNNQNISKNLRGRLVIFLSKTKKKTTHTYLHTSVCLNL